MKRVCSWIENVESQYGYFDSFISNLDKSNLLMVRANVSRLFCVVHNSIEAELKSRKKTRVVELFKRKKAKKALNHQHVITVSEGITKEIQSLSWLHPKTIDRVYNPFNFSDLHNQAHREIDSLPKEPYMIHVGRVAKQKTS